MTVDSLLSALRSCSEPSAVLRDLRPVVRTAPLTSEQLRGLVDALIPLLQVGRPNVRRLAATCLLQIAGTASKADLVAHAARIVDAASDTLVEAQLGVHDTHTLALALACLRLLKATISKCSAIARTTLQALVETIVYWSHYDGEDARARIGGIVAPRQPRRRMSSASSASSGLESDASDTGGPSERRFAPTQLRLAALDCLMALAESHSSPLHAHWNLLLPSSSAQRRTLLDLIEFDRDASVRLRACSVLAAMLVPSRNFLSIADDAPAKASFTAISTQLGRLLGQLHLRLSRAVTTATSAEATCAVLSVWRVLIAVSPYSKLSSGLFDGLWPALDALTAGSDGVVVDAAVSTQLVIARAVHAAPAQLAADRLLATAHATVDRIRSGDGRVEQWALLGSLLASLPAEPLPFDLLDDFATERPAVQVAQLGLVGDALPSRSLEMREAERLRAILNDAGGVYVEPTVRSAAAAAMASLPETIELGGFADLLVRFIGDSIESVRIAVIRSAGQLSRHHDIAAHLPLLEALVSPGDAPPIRAAAAYVLSLICQSDRCVSITKALSVAAEAALRYTHGKEQVATRCSGYRALGHLLARSPVGIVGAVECLQRELDAPSTNAKVTLAVVDAIRTAFASSSSPGSRQLVEPLTTLAIDQGPLKLRSAASSALLLESLRPTVDAAKVAAAIDTLDSASSGLSYADAVHARALRANLVALQVPCTSPA